MRRMQSRKNRIANEPEAIKASGSLHFVCISRSELHTIRFFDSENEAQDSAQEFRTAKDTTFILSPPNKSFCTEPRQTSPAEQPKRPAKIAPGKIGQPKAPHQTQSKSSSAASPISHRQHRPCARWREERPLAKHLFSKMLTFSICRDGKSVREKNKSS